MESHEIAEIEANLFQAARALLSKRPDFPWHRDARSARSSQALAVDFFGTIGQLASRDAIVSEWISHMSLALSSYGSWKITLEVPVPGEMLGETRPTQIDALAQCDSSFILFECKFTESDGGACSQPDIILEGPHRGLRQCTGNYEEQTNPLNQIRSRCALTPKGIKYWQLVPEVMDLDPNVDYGPCPFSSGWPHGSWFQWMRNLVAALELGRSHQALAAFVVVYADGPFPMARKVKNADWVSLENAVAGRSVPLRSISYQELLGLARKASASADRSILDELSLWMAHKIDIAGGTARMPITERGR